MHNYIKKFDKKDGINRLSEQIEKKHMAKVFGQTKS
jgi:hypothetical protein